MFVGTGDVSLVLVKDKSLLSLYAKTYTLLRSQFLLCDSSSCKYNSDRLACWTPISLLVHISIMISYFIK